MQFLIVSSQILFSILAFNLCILIKQRISVPELRSQIWKYFLLVFSLISISFCLCILLFFNSTSLYTSKYLLGLTDNVFFLIYLISLFVFCKISYSFLKKLENPQIPNEKYYLNIKMYLLAVMGIALFQYFFSLLLLSYYQPIIYIEKLLTSTLIILKEINSFLFMMCLVMFVISLKYDFFYLYMDLNTRPDLEYFKEDEETIKMIKQHIIIITLIKYIYE